MTQLRYLIFGCGYLGRRVAQRWLDSGATVCIVSRNTKRANELRDAGFEALVADVTQPATLTKLDEASTVLFAVGYDRTSPYTIEQVYVDGLRNVLESLPDSTRRFIYVSSTGVYGPSDNDWLDEASPCHPTRAGGQACLTAERILQAHSLGERSVIIRMAGLYGPGRVPQSEALKSGDVTAPPLDSYLNLIHVDDAADCVVAAAARSIVPNLLIAADGHPVQRRDYYREVLRLLNLDEALLQRIRIRALERGRGSKRVSNAKLLSQLKFELTYPDYRAGLAQAFLAADSGE